MLDVLEPARQELAIIEAEIEALRDKANGLRRLIEEGSSILSKAGIRVDQTNIANRKAMRVGGLAATAPMQTVKARVARGVAALLRKAQPQTSRQLLDGLAQMGITLNGREPVTNLAAVLANAKDLFRNERGEGYYLIERQTSELTRQSQLSPLRNPPVPDNGTVPATD